MGTGYPIHTTTPRLWVKPRPEARRMRHDPTPAEELLWERLRRRKLGTRFRRQHAISRFIVDFVCFPQRLIIELDGSSHEGRTSEDKIRNEILHSIGFSVIRFSNEHVLRDPDSVIDEIRNRLRFLQSARVQSSPSPHGEGAGG